MKNNSKTNIYKILNKFYKIVRGHKIARNLIKRNDGCRIISTYSGVGDRVFLLAYLKQYLEHNKICNYKVVSATNDNSVYKYFGIEEDNLIYLAKKEMIMLNEFYMSDWGFLFRHRNPELLSVSIGAYIRSDLFNYSSFFKYSDFIKSVFNLPLSTMPNHIVELKMSEKLAKYFDSGKLVLGKTVIINPYGNSCNRIPMEFFQKISDRLLDEGIEVVTSTIGDQMSLVGTKGINFKLEDAVDFCNNCGYVIGQRSGFMDLISFSKAKIICVDDILYPHSEIYRLDKCWPQNTAIETIRYGTNEDGILVDYIVQKIKEWRIIDEMDR